MKRKDFRPQPQAAEEKVSQLTARELKIAFLLSSGLSKREVSERLGVALKTIDNQARTIYLKTGVHSQHELAALLKISGRPPAS